MTAKRLSDEANDAPHAPPAHRPVEITDLTGFEPPRISSLFSEHRTSQDACILFNEPQHVYALLVNGRWLRAQTSASGVGSRFFGEFDGPAVIDGMLASPKCPTSRYRRLFYDAYRLELVAQLHDIIAAGGKFKTGLGLGLLLQFATKLPADELLPNLDAALPMLRMMHISGRAWPVVHEEYPHCSAEQLVESYAHYAGQQDLALADGRAVLALVDGVSVPPFDVNPRIKAWILELWASTNPQGSALGTEMHAAIEDELNGIPFTREWRARPEIGYYNDFVREWLPQLNAVFYRTEMRMCSDERYLLAGTADVIMAYNHQPDDDVLHLAILDWKRSKKDVAPGPDPFGKCGHGPCAQLPDTAFSHYLINTNVYKFLLETYVRDLAFCGKIYKRCVVDKMFLVVLHPVHGRYLVEEVPAEPQLLADVLVHFELRSD